MNDLTQGKPFSVIWRFSLPLLLSMALQQLYNLADSIIVGRFTGEAGLAAIGAAYPMHTDLYCHCHRCIHGMQCGTPALRGKAPSR